jgi:hypothetical protein
MRNDRRIITDELRKMWKEEAASYLDYFARIHLDGVTKLREI